MIWNTISMVTAMVIATGRQARKGGIERHRRTIVGKNATRTPQAFTSNPTHGFLASNGNSAALIGSGRLGSSSLTRR